MHYSFTHPFAQLTHLHTAGATVRGQPCCTQSQKWMVIPIQPWFLDRCLETPLRLLVPAGVCYTCSFCLHAAAHFLSRHGLLCHRWLMDTFTSLLVSSVCQFLAAFHVLAHGSMFLLFTHCFLVMVPPSTCVGPWEPCSGRLMQRSFCGRSSAAEATNLTLRDTECAWEKGRTDPVA